MSNATVRAILEGRRRRAEQQAQRRNLLQNLALMQMQRGDDPGPVLRAAGSDLQTLEAFQSAAKSVRNARKEQERTQEQKQRVAQVREEGAPENLAALLAANAPESREATVNLLRRFEGPGGRVRPEAEDVVRQVSAQVPVARAQQRARSLKPPATENERIIAQARSGQLGPEAQAFVNSPEFGSRLAASALGGGGTRLSVGPDGSIQFEQGSTGALSGFRQNKLVAEAQGNAQARRLVRSMVSTLEQSPSAEGFAASVTNAVSRGLGTIEGLDRFLGTNFNEFVGSGRLQAIADGRRPASRKVRSVARKVLNKVRAGNVGELEVLQELLVLSLADALRPAESRVTNQLFERLERRVNFKDKRNNTIRRLRTLDNELEARAKNIDVRAKRSDVELPVFDISPLGPEQQGGGSQPPLQENQFRMPDGTVVDLEP